MKYMQLLLEYAHGVESLYGNPSQHWVAELSNVNEEPICTSNGFHNMNQNLGIVRTCCGWWSKRGRTCTRLMPCYYDNVIHHQYCWGRDITCMNLWHALPMAKLQSLLHTCSSNQINAYHFASMLVTLVPCSTYLLQAINIDHLLGILQASMIFCIHAVPRYSGINRNCKNK